MRDLEKEYRAIALYRQGLSYDAVAAHVGRSHEWVRGVIKKRGLQREPKECVVCHNSFVPTHSNQRKCAGCAPYEPMDPVETVSRIRKKLADKGLRRCCICKKIKHLARDFYRSARNGKPGYDYRCKECSGKQVAKYRKKQIEGGRVGVEVLNTVDKERVKTYLRRNIYSQNELARMFDVSQATISLIKREIEEGV